MPYFDEPVRWVKIQTTSKILTNCNTSHQKRLISFVIQLFSVFLVISHKAGKTKRTEKRSRPLNRFFNSKKQPAVHVVYIFALFELYFVQLDYKPNYHVVPFTNAAPQIP